MSTKIKTPTGWKTVANNSCSEEVNYIADDTATTLPERVWTTLLSMPIKKGKYIVNFTAKFESANVYMNGGVTINQDAAVWDYQDISPEGIYGYMNGRRFINISSDTTLYFRVMTTTNSRAIQKLLSAQKVD
jgi:hypothetical protein